MHYFSGPMLSRKDPRSLAIPESTVDSGIRSECLLLRFCVVDERVRVRFAENHICGGDFSGFCYRERMSGFSVRWGTRGVLSTVMVATTANCKAQH